MTLNNIPHRVFIVVLRYALVLASLQGLQFVGLIHQTTVWVAAIAILGLYRLFYACFSRTAQFLDPETLVPFTYMMYALGPLKHRALYTPDTVTAYLLCMLLGLFALHLGLAVLHRASDRAPAQGATHDTAMAVSILVLFAISLASALSEIQAFGSLSNLLNFGYGGDRFVLLSNSLTFGGSFQWGLLSSLLLLWYGLGRKSFFLSLLGGASGLVFLSVLFLIGARSTIVYGILFMIILLWGRRTLSRRLTIVLVLGFLFGISLAQLYASARYYLPQGMSETIRQTWRIFKLAPANLLPLPMNIGEFTVPARSLMDVLQNEPGTRFFGATYLHVAGTLIPGISRLIGDIGVNPATWLLERFYPGVLEVGGGLGFSPVTEGYLNFGIIGILLQMFFYGLISKYLYLKMKTATGPFWAMVYASAFPILVLDAVRIHAASTLYKFGRIYLIPALIFWLITFLMAEKHRSIQSLNPQQERRLYHEERPLF